MYYSTTTGCRSNTLDCLAESSSEASQEDRDSNASLEFDPLPSDSESDTEDWEHLQRQWAEGKLISALLGHDSTLSEEAPSSAMRDRPHSLDLIAEILPYLTHAHLEHCHHMHRMRHAGPNAIHLVQINLWLAETEKLITEQTADDEDHPDLEVVHTPPDPELGPAHRIGMGLRMRQLPARGRLADHSSQICCVTGVLTSWEAILKFIGPKS